MLEQALLPPPSETTLAVHRERRLLVCVGGASITMFVALSWPALSGLTYAGTDLDGFHLPMRQFYARCLAEGTAFDWMPDILCGFYLTGEGQTGGYHPLHWLLYRWLPLEVAFNLEVLLSYPFAFAGMCFFLRQIGLRWASAMFGALTFTFSGFCLLHFMHINGIAVVAHIPWLLSALDIAMRDGPPRRRLSAWGVIVLLTASQVLLGYPQYVWMSVVAELAWVCYAAGEHRARVIGCLVAALGWGAVIGSVQLLPTYDQLVGSQRRTPGATVSHVLPLKPGNAIQLVAPYLLKDRVLGDITHEFGLYAGAVPLMLAAWGLTRRRELGAMRHTFIGVLLFAGLTFLLALGRHGLLYYVQTWLPVVSSFRVSARYIVLVHLSLAILAAIAFDALTRPDRKNHHGSFDGLWRLVAMSVLATVLAGLFIRGNQLAAPLADWRQAPGYTLFAWLSGPMLLAAAAAIIRRTHRGNWAAGWLVVLTAVDLGVYGFSYAVYPGARPLDAIIRDAPEPAAADAPRLKAWMPSSPLFLGNQFILRGARLVDGYVGLFPVNQLDYSTTAALRLAGVGPGLHLTLQGKYPAQRPVASLDVAAEDPLPRIRLVVRAVVCADPAKFLPTTPIETTAQVDEPLDLDDGPPGTCRWKWDQPGDLGIEMDTPGRQLLVIADRFHPGWQATVDDQPVPVYRLYGDFMGVVIGPGMHTARLQFRPASLTWGRRLTWLGLAGLGLFWLMGHLWCRRQHC